MSEALRQLARAGERDRYLASLYAPDDKRPQLWALYAFAAEISRIPHLVSEPQIGEIRLQWWVDTLDAIGRGEAVDHPVAQALGAVVHEAGLPVEHLQGLVLARQHDLYADQFLSREELETYVAETEAALMQFAAMVLDKSAAARDAALIGLAGSAYGLARLLARPGLQVKFVPAGETIESLRGLAHLRLHQAREARFSDNVLPAVLPAALTEQYLSGRMGPLGAQWTLWRAARKKKI